MIFLAFERSHYFCTIFPCLLFSRGYYISCCSFVRNMISHMFVLPRIFSFSYFLFDFDRRWNLFTVSFKVVGCLKNVLVIWMKLLHNWKFEFERKGFTSLLCSKVSVSRFHMSKQGNLFSFKWKILQAFNFNSVLLILSYVFIQHNLMLQNSFFL